MKFKITSFVLFFISINFCSANDTIPVLKKRNFGLHIGLPFFTVKDQTLSPLRYEGNGFTTRLNFSSQNKKRVHDLRFYFGQGDMESSISTSRSHFMDHFYGGLEYVFLKKIKNERINTFIGGAFQTSFSQRSLYFDFNNSEFSFDLSGSLNLFFILQKKINNKHLFQYQFRYPIMAYVVGRVRHPGALPEEIIDELLDDEDSIPSLGVIVTSGDFLFINKYIDLQSEFKYEVAIGKRMGFSAIYLFRYFQFSKLDKYQFGRSEFMVGLNYKW